jgi:hypothetical protein
MMTDYTLAGPDIGVQRVDFAGLVAELGDDAALDAVAATENGSVHLRSGEPMRLIRRFKSGDEALGFDYFARKAGVSAEERQAAAASSDDEEEEPTSSREAPIEGEHFGMSAQRLFATHSADPSMVPLQRATVRFNISVPVTILVRARDEAETNDVVRRLMNGDDFAENTGLLFQPLDVLAHAVTYLKRADTMKDAGWSANTLTAQPIGSEESEKILKRLVAEELRLYQREVASNVDVLASFIEGIER